MLSFNLTQQSGLLAKLEDKMLSNEIEGYVPVGKNDEERRKDTVLLTGFSVFTGDV